MKKNTDNIVYWTPRVPDNLSISERVLESHQSIYDLIVEEPVPFNKWLLMNRSEESVYMRCPAFIDFFKNVFVITAPFDIIFSIDKNTRYITTDVSQEIYDIFFENRGNQSSPEDPPIITLPPSIVFWSENDIMMESLPLFLSNNTATENLNLIPGSFNIGKWIRPVDFTVEIKDCSKRIFIKRGDPLFCVKFITTNGKKIELERVEYTNNLEKVVIGCTGLKKFIPKQTLKSVYDIAEKFITRFKNKQKNH